MSAAAPEQGAPATARPCPRCGTPLTDTQEWCLHCGAAVGSRIVAAPGWRTPIAIVGALLALAAVAVAIALVQLADDADQVAENPAAAAAPVPTPAPPVPTPTPVPTVSPGATPTPEAEATPTPTPAPAPSPEATPSPSATPTPEATGDLGEWPDGKTGWTVVLASDESRSDAEQRARGFQRQGVAGVGLLDSDDFSSLEPGFWVVFSGQYESQSAAAEALDGIEARDAYIRRIRPDG